MRVQFAYYVYCRVFIALLLYGLGLRLDAAWARAL